MAQVLSAPQICYRVADDYRLTRARFIERAIGHAAVNKTTGYLPFDSSPGLLPLRARMIALSRAPLLLFPLRFVK